LGTIGDDLVNKGFIFTNSKGIQLSVPATVTSVFFKGATSDNSGPLTLSNDALTGTGTITDNSYTGTQRTHIGSDIKITSETIENILIKVFGSSTQSIYGASDSQEDSGLGALTNYRDDTLKITDAAFSASTFSMSGDNLLITMATGGVKTVTEVEAVKFSDGTTVRVVGADGYASFAEAMTQTNTSHANVGDYIYGSSAKGYTPTDLTHLTAVSGLTDFYTYHA
jgi:hypothetical protein